MDLAASDAARVAAARAGLPQGREAVFRHEVQLVHALAFHLAGRFGDARALTEVSFRQVFGRLGELTHVETWRAFLAGIIVRAVHSAIKSPHRWHRLRARLGLVTHPHAAFLGARAELTPGPRAALDELFTAIDSWPLKTRAAYVLCRLHGFDPADAALALEVSVTDVRRRLVRADARRARGVPRAT